MKYKLTETEKFDPTYRYVEAFDSREEAQDRLAEWCQSYVDHPAVSRSEVNENSAIFYLNDGNEIEYDISEKYE